MAKKRTKINLSQPIQPRGGDLEQLFTTEGDAEQAAGLQLLAVRVDAIDPDPDQPRSTFNDAGLLELAESIRQDGVIQPIEVTQSSPGRYLIVHGERRWRASHLAGLTTIPAVVRRRDYDDVTRFVRQVVENIQREDLNDVDRAAALLRLRKLMQEELDATLAGQPSTGEPWGGKVTWAKVGNRLGYSRQRIHQLIQLLDLPDEIKEAVRGGLLTERDTRVYQGLTPVQQRALHRSRLAGDLNSGEVRQIARLLREAPEMTVAAASRLLDEAASEQSIAEADRPLLPCSPSRRPRKTQPRGTSAGPDSPPPRPRRCAHQHRAPRLGARPSGAHRPPRPDRRRAPGDAAPAEAHWG